MHKGLYQMQSCVCRKRNGRRGGGVNTVIINQALKYLCEGSIIFRGLDGRYVSHSVECFPVGIVHPPDVGIIHHYEGQELQIHEAASQALG